MRQLSSRLVAAAVGLLFATGAAAQGAAGTGAAPTSGTGLTGSGLATSITSVPPHPAGAAQAPDNGASASPRSSGPDQSGGTPPAH